MTAILSPKPPCEGSSPSAPNTNVCELRIIAGHVDSYISQANPVVSQVEAQEEKA